MDALSDNGYKENTVVALWSDHGYHLGDTNSWCKMTNFEKATRNTLLWRVPGQVKPPNTRTSPPCRQNGAHGRFARPRGPRARAARTLKPILRPQQTLRNGASTDGHSVCCTLPPRCHHAATTLPPRYHHAATTLPPHQAAASQGLNSRYVEMIDFFPTAIDLVGQ